MPTFYRSAIDTRLKTILWDYQEYISFLKKHCKPDGRILNMGCDSGYEAIALLWFLDAEKVWGINKDLTNVADYSLEFKRELTKSIEALQLTMVPPEDRRWWKKEVPKCLREGKFPEFKEQDISEMASAQKNWEREFDLVYCSSVLCHIHTYQGSKAVASAIQSAYFVTKPGAWMVASEPDNDELDYFDAEITHAGFNISREIKSGTKLYVCQRPLA